MDQTDEKSQTFFEKCFNLLDLKNDIQHVLYELKTDLYSLQRKIEDYEKLLRSSRPPPPESVLHHQFEGIKLSKKFLDELQLQKNKTLLLSANDKYLSVVNLVKYPQALKEDCFYPFVSCSKPISLRQFGIPFSKIKISYNTDDCSCRSQPVVCGHGRVDTSFLAQRWEGDIIQLRIMDGAISSSTYRYAPIDSRSEPQSEPQSESVD